MEITIKTILSLDHLKWKMKALKKEIKIHSKQ